MNRQKMNFLPTLLIALVILIASLFLYVISKAEIRKMLRQKDYLNEKINERNNSIEMKIVEVQKLISEERIVPLAELRFGMIKNRNNADEIKVNNKKLQQISEFIKLKYD